MMWSGNKPVAGPGVVVVAVVALALAAAMARSPHEVALESSGQGGAELRWPLVVHYEVRVADPDVGARRYHDARLVLRAEGPVHWTLEHHPSSGTDVECFQQAGALVRDLGVSAEGCGGVVVSQWQASLDEHGNPLPEVVDATVAFGAQDRIDGHARAREAAPPDLVFEYTPGARLPSYEADGICDYGACRALDDPASAVSHDARDRWVFDEELDLPVARQLVVDGDVVLEVRAVTIERG